MEPTSQLGASTSLPQLNKGPQILSGSGSFQSYLSSAGSHHRHAKGATVHLENQSSVHTDKSQSPYLQSVVEASSHPGPLSGVVRFITNFPGFLLEDLHRFRYGHLGRLRILLSLYCCVSVTFLSFKMHSALRGAVAAGRPHIGHSPSTLLRILKYLFSKMQTCQTWTHCTVFPLSQMYRFSSECPSRFQIRPLVIWRPSSWLLIRQWTVTSPLACGLKRTGCTTPLAHSRPGRVIWTQSFVMERHRLRFYRSYISGRRDVGSNGPSNRAEKVSRAYEPP